MSYLFHTYIYNPIFWLLNVIYQNASFHDLGIAIILLTVIVRVVLLPIFYKGAKDQTTIQKIQPHVKKIQLDHKDDKERQAKELMELYKKHSVNPFSSILFLAIQIPIFIALFRIFTNGVNSSAFGNHIFLGFIDLGAKSLILALIAAFLQYLQLKMMVPANLGAGGAAAANQKIMMYAGPAITLLVMFNLPSAIGLYWSVSNLFSIGQQFYINKKIKISPDKSISSPNPTI